MFGSPAVFGLGSGSYSSFPASKLHSRLSGSRPGPPQLRHSQTDCFGLHPSVIVEFSPAQTKHTKGKTCQMLQHCALNCCGNVWSILIFSLLIELQFVDVKFKRCHVKILFFLVHYTCMHQLLQCVHFQCRNKQTAF